ncbi:MAG TPA: aminotransferase class V-fold PLP-dependent enzyme [Bryobacteraceae bacterium]
MNLLSRRGLFQRGGWLAGAGWFGLKQPKAAAAPLEVGPNLYTSIGVKPLINCKGTYTIISGSQSLPEVKRAMELASHSYVHIDELMEAVGRRLSELTQAEWGIVTAGCAAALTHATAACIAGADPEKMQRVPNLTGLKNQVVVPRYSRNDYDHAVRMLGVKMVEVETAAEFEAALTPQTAMVMILSCPAAEKGELSIENACRMARAKGVPVIVDAAAEMLTIPNIHLQHGATMVAYSGGKCLRGPQTAGLLLGPKALVQAAFLNSAPHHAFGRSLKIGKEEIMGMLAAVEMWVKRDHEAEWRQWQAWIDHIGERARQVNGVTTEILQPEDLSNRSPQLLIRWDGKKLGITGKEMDDLLFHGDPRIIVGGSHGDRRRDMASSIVIMPYMMMPGDDKIAGEAIYRLLSNPPRIPTPEPRGGTLANVDGQWEAHVTFFQGASDHRFVFEQQADKLVGTHRGDILTGDLHGSVEGNRVMFHSRHRIEGKILDYDFTADVAGDAMEGEVDMNEYGKARFTARRHKYA